MSTTPQFASTVRATTVQVSTANTNRDGTGTIVTSFTAGTSGSRIEAVEICATGTTTAGMVRLFINDGTNSRLIREQAIPARTPSGTVPAFQMQLVFGDYSPLLLPATYSLRAATNNAETFNITVYGGDF